jgi:hypothetical protein
MRHGGLTEPFRGVFGRLAIEHGNAPRGTGLRVISELLGVASGQIGVVIGFELFAVLDEWLVPVGKITTFLVLSPRRIRWQSHGGAPG